MAIMTLTNAYVTVNSVNLSDHVRRVVLDYDADEVDSTAMGDTFHERLASLRDWSVSIEFQQDFAASSVDATLFPLVGSTTTVEVRPINAARSATNPGYSGTVLVNDYQPISGAVGDLATVSVTWPGAGPLSRLTA